MALAGTARATSQRATLERWLAMARAGAAERGNTALADAAAEPGIGETGSVLAERDTPKVDEVTAPEAATLLAALLPGRIEEVATARGGVQERETASIEEQPGVQLMPAAALAAPGFRPVEAPTADGEVSLAAGGPELAVKPAAGDMQPAAGREETPKANSPRNPSETGEAPGAGSRLQADARDEAAMRQALKTETESLPASEVRRQPDGALRDAVGGASTAAAQGAGAAMPAFAAELARAGQAVAAAGGHGPGPHHAELHLHTPVTTPAFVPHLTGELAVLARDGVQEARVQVSPQELGPIAVQITLDGSAAQVRLAVDSPVTRDLLEQAMPSLAAALRENGLTLTGGGVFQQAPGNGRDGRGADAPPARSDAPGRDGDSEPVAVATAARRVRHPGQVDLYA